MKHDPAPLVIRPLHPLTADARALIDASQMALLEVYPPEECFSSTAEELAVPGAQFFAAYLGDAPVGCVALVDTGRYGEVKRLYVAPEARGRGVGTALMDTLETAAHDFGLPVLKLETGEALAAACALYRARGYVECEPFGGYPDIESNLFLEKPL
ncbi:GNAT family N-acetyltransferase [Tranquillimonas alkanivorans]|uniref:Putative acetyltransferase n=1 Tax=Tranquillimonas alkanivorans TaxID=441119 RepID=A0A1I5PKL4_9RHOB|nr:GNAT family N-acetyltransferase [Tranquillimonas alkanivorans]SFP34595.1 putative acetyltransferase [Tranquillimonas alkanivorans]